MSTRRLKKHLRYIVPQVRLALMRESGPKPVSIQCPDDLERFVEPLKHYSEEYFVSFHLSSRNQITNYQIVSHGSLSASIVHPREVFKAAIIANAHSIIVAHNHPGGSVDPSMEDIDTTTTLVQAGRILGVEVVDHIIVSSYGLTSLRETQPHLWLR